MQQLTYFAKNKLRFIDAPDPEIQDPRDVIVRPFAAARCDVETAFFRHK